MVADNCRGARRRKYIRTEDARHSIFPINFSFLVCSPLCWSYPPPLRCWLLAVPDDLLVESPYLHFPFTFIFCSCVRTCCLSSTQNTLISRICHFNLHKTLLDINYVWIQVCGSGWRCSGFRTARAWTRLCPVSSPSRLYFCDGGLILTGYVA